jgi:hypothetical protein
LLTPAGTLDDVRSGLLRVTESGLVGRAAAAQSDDDGGGGSSKSGARQRRPASPSSATPQHHQPRGPPSNAVWRPATPEQQRQSLQGVVQTAQAVLAAEAEAAAAAAAAAPSSPPPAASLAAAAELGADTASLLLGDVDDADLLDQDATYAASVGAPAVDAALDQHRRQRQQQQEQEHRHRRSLQQFGGGGLPPTTSASHAAPVKVGACGLAELTGGSSLASPSADGVGMFGWAIAVNKGADVMVIGQPSVDVDAALYADVVNVYEDQSIGAAFIFAAVPGGGGAGVSLGFAKSCSFADQRLVNPVWRVEKAVVGFGTEVAVSFKGDTALAAGRIIPDPAQTDDDTTNPPYYSNLGSDQVWAFRKEVTGYVQFSRQELPLVNPYPPGSFEQVSDDGVLRRVMALGLSHDGGLAMAAFVTVDLDDASGGMDATGGSVQIFGSTKERFLLTQVLPPPEGAVAESWSVAAAMSADSQTIIACDGSGADTLVEDQGLFDPTTNEPDVFLADGSGVFVYSRTDGLALTKPDGKVGLVQSNATASYTLAGLLRPPLWSEDLAPGVYNATATFGTALAITAKGKFIAVVERRYVRRPPAQEEGDTAADGDGDEDLPEFYVAHFVHVYQRVEGTGQGLTAMYALKCTLDDPDPARFAQFGYGRHQLAIAQDGNFVTVAIGSVPSTLTGPQVDLPNSVYVYRIVAGQSAGKGEDICPFEPEFVVDDPMFAGSEGGTATSSGDQPSFFGEAVALSANGKVLVVGTPRTMVADEAGSVYLYDLRKPVKKDVYSGNAPLVGVGGYARRRSR